MKRLSVLSLLISTFFLIISCTRNQTPVAAFYGIDESTCQTIIRSLEQWYEDSPWTSLVLDDTRSLSDNLKQNKNITVVFSWYGAGAEQSVPKLITPPVTLYDLYPATVRNLSQTWLPLLSDHEEAAWRLRNLKKRQAGMPDTVSETVEFMADKTDKEMPARWSIAIPGGDDRSLSMLISALIESTWNAETAATLNQLITEAEQKRLEAAKKSKKTETRSVFDAVHAVPLNSEGATLDAVIALLNSWNEEELLHPDWKNRDKPYVETLMSDGQAELVFMPLSMHRKMSFRVLQNFTESFVPVNRTGSSFDRSLVLPALCVAGVHQTQKGADEETLSLLAYLTSRDTISELSIISGYAPLNATSEAADTQASNVRFWAAASSVMVQDLASAFTTRQERTAFFEELRRQLQ